MTYQKKTDEIDLLDLLVKFVNVFIANFWLIVAFFVLGTAIGVSYYFTTAKVYETRMIVSSDILTDSYAKILFENATKQIEQANTAALQEQLHISEKAARSITALKIESVSRLETPEIKENERFVITVEVFDQQILPELQRGIIEYLENNNFAKIRVAQKRTFYEQMIASIDKEIQDMEDFKSKIFTGDFFQSTKGNVMFDPTTVNSKILELKEKRISYKNNLELISSVQVIEPFVQFKKQKSPRLSTSMTAGASLGLILAGLFLGFRAIQKIASAKVNGSHPS